METSQLMISNYIDTFENINFLRGKLLEKGIYSKIYSEEGLLLIYTKYEPIVKSISNLVKNEKTEELLVSELNNLSEHDLNKLKMECRSLIIDIEEKKIVSYSCNTPICNLDAINYLLNSKNKKNFEEGSLKSKLKIEKFKCYEGTLLSLFCNKNKWYLSTRRNLNSEDSVWNNVSYYDLFLEIIKESGIESFEEFVSNLDMSYCYYFILIHHKNKNIVDYTNIFGNDYKRLCLAFVREKNSLSEIDLDSLVRDDENSTHFSEPIKNSLKFILNLKNIFLPEKIDSDLTSVGNGSSSPTSFELKSNTYNESMTSCDDEGIIIKIKNEYNMSYFLKIQTYSYQFNKAIGAEKNIFKGFLNLYQNNQLVNYLQSNENLSNFRKIINPINIHESYDTIGIIDSVFKVCTSELYELFKILWDIKTGKQSDTEIYKILPKEYKSILYYIRGIYFKKKFSNESDINDLNCKQSSETLSGMNESLQPKGLNRSSSRNSMNSIKKNEIQIKDIYQYLKKGLDTDKLEQFLRVRKLMYNWIKVDSENESLKKFSKINIKCDKVHLKLIAIFSNKLFPNIMPDDIPDPTNLSKSFGSLNSFGSLSSLNQNES